MKKVQVKVDAYVFSGEEIARLRELLNYCQHRIIDHEYTGLAKLRWTKDFVKYMLEMLKEG